jgi:hypothetical protein
VVVHKQKVELPHTVEQQLLVQVLVLQLWHNSPSHALLQPTQLVVLQFLPLKL